MIKQCIFLAAVITIIGCLTGPNVLSVENEDAVMEINAFKEYQNKSNFNQEKMGKRIQKSLNSQVKYASHLLKRRGIEYGKTSLSEWELKYSKAFLAAEIGQLDIGDHPAIPWLLNFYNKLESYLGPDILRSQHLDDIKWMAYAIPVVFSPKNYERLDYNQHFIPFSKACGYWGCLAACTAYQYLGTPISTFICSPISYACRMAFGMIGDPLSYAIWDGAHK